MTIVNDVVTFQASDFSGLSSFAVQAIQHQAGSTSVMLAKLSKEVTSTISFVKNRYIRETVGGNADVASLLAKFAAASPATLAAAADEIAALSAALTP